MNTYKILAVGREPGHGHLVSMRLAISGSDPLTINMIAAYRTLASGDEFVWEDGTTGERGSVFGAGCTTCGQWTLRAVQGGTYYEHLQIPALEGNSGVVNMQIARITPDPPVSTDQRPEMYRIRDEMTPTPRRRKNWAWMGRQ